MLEIVEGFPDNIIAVVAKGQVSRRDYSDVLAPGVENAFRRHRKMRCYYELGREFSGMDSGAVWEDFKIGAEHLAHRERVAVVTDVEWVRLTARPKPGRWQRRGTRTSFSIRRPMARSCRSCI